MGFQNLGFTELLIIGLIVLLLFGAKRLPEIGQSMGKGIKEFKKSLSDVDKEIRDPGTSRDEFTRRPAGDLPPRTDDHDRPEPKRLLS